MFFAKLVLCISLSVVTVNSARILAWFPTPSISHQLVYRPLTQELAKRGHEVVVITTDLAFPPGNSPTNLTEIDCHDSSYDHWEKIAKITTDYTVDHITQLRQIQLALSKIFEMQLNNKEVQKVIRQNFDLLIFESCCRAALALPVVLKVPLIVINSLGGISELYDIMGAPCRPPWIHPTYLSQKINNPSLIDKITELYKAYEFSRQFESLIEIENILVKKYFGDDIPDLRELRNNVDLTFLNVNPIWDLNRPVPPGIVYMGGLHQQPEKELPKNLKSYLDSSKHGVIYISYGTNVRPSLLPAEKIQLLVKVFSQLPYDVLWKWDKDVLPGKTDNIRISKWLPQSDLLRHPNVKIFITQGGLQSTDEAITAGVPLLGMPVFSDQWYNVELYVKLEIGLRVDMESITESEFKNAILTLMNDKSYVKNIVKLRNIMKDQPQTPLERAVWWTEYVLRHGGAKHLRAPTANMTWAEYLDFKLLAVLSGIALTGLVVFGVVVRAVYVVIIKRLLSSVSKLKKS